jgi:predicted hydrocarbon binding protein
MEIQCKKAEVKKNLNLKCKYEKGEIRLFDTRVALTNLLPACKKIDKIFGSGAEVIVHCIASEQGRQLFKTAITNNPDTSKAGLLEEVVDIQTRAGWGITHLEIIKNDPLRIEVTVKNSPIKVLQGSLKHLIGSFWTGILSEAFGRQLKCESFSYDEKEDTLRCILTS